TLTLTPPTNRIINHNELPPVKDELSMTLKINLMSHDVGWAAIFHKGRTAVTERTPSLWLTPQKSALHPRYTTNIDMNRGIDGIFGNEILFNRWYHIAYILSNIEKRMDSSIILVQNEFIIFNDAPLYIGNDTYCNGINGQISNFRYYNFALSRGEVEMDYL
ncbi:7881_t:CDS:2, partial [Entrophospora sp. SA101]